MAYPVYKSEEDYLDILRLLPASESNNAMPYADWLENLEGHKKLVASQGYIPHGIEINPSAVKVWREKQNLPLCRKSIAAYAMFELGRLLSGS